MKPDQIAIVVQARMSSTRLPGKVLMPLAGRPAIVRMMERVERVKGAGHRIVATSDQPSDDALVAVCRDVGIPVFRGPLDDVLARYVAALPDGAEAAVRLTGDCPLVDPALVDRHIARFVEEQPHTEYVANVVERTYPRGLDVEVVRRDLLEQAAREASEPGDREHVTPWVQRRARSVAITEEVDLSAIRWTLDTEGDYRCLAGIYDALLPDRPEFVARDVYALLLERPDLIRIEGQEALSEAERASWLRRIEARLECGALA